MYEDGIYADRAPQSGRERLRHEGERSDMCWSMPCIPSHGASEYLSPDVAQKLALRLTTATVGSPTSLSPREFEILRLLVKGLPVKDIAESMGLEPQDGGQPPIGDQAETRRRIGRPAHPHRRRPAGGPRRRK